MSDTMEMLERWVALYGPKSHQPYDIIRKEDGYWYAGQMIMDHHALDIITMAKLRELISTHNSVDIKRMSSLNIHEVRMVIWPDDWTIQAPTLEEAVLLAFEAIEKEKVKT